MKVKNISVIALTNSIEDKDAAAYINRIVSEGIGSTAFNAKDEEIILQAFEEQIESCAECIKKNLKIEIEETEFDEEE